MSNFLHDFLVAIQNIELCMYINHITLIVLLYYYLVLFIIYDNIIILILKILYNVNILIKLFTYYIVIFTYYIIVFFYYKFKG